MKRDFPVTTALFLVFGCVIFRLVGSAFPELMPNISPVMAVSFVGAMYLPRTWGWLVGPVAFIATDLAFVRVNYLTGGAGAMFSWWTILSLAIFALAGGAGLFLAHRKSLARVLGGCLACSLLFYVASNTFSWGYDVAIRLTPGYPATLAGWWQANTIGLPGYIPTWTFLRNGTLGDLFFGIVLLLVLDPGLLIGRRTVRAGNEARLA